MTNEKAAFLMLIGGLVGLFLLKVLSYFINM
jgi:hypothetical protein